MNDQEILMLTKVNNFSIALYTLGDYKNNSIRENPNVILKSPSLRTAARALRLRPLEHSMNQISPRALIGPIGKQAHDNTWLVVRG